MRRLLLVAVMGAVAVLPPAVQAQRGFAARGGGGMAPRVSAPPARAMGGPGPRAFAAGGVVASRQFGHASFGGNAHFRHRHHFFFTSGCFGNGFCSGFSYPYYGYGYGYGYPYYPLFGGDYGYAQQPNYAQQQPSVVVVRGGGDDTDLHYAVDRLADQVAQLRAQQETRQAPPTPRPSAESTPTVLVFRDGHRSETQNYGIVGQTLWVFSEHHARKYPLSALDLSATKAANEERGMDFMAPAR